jgi:hypothetical protein
MNDQEHAQLILPIHWHFSSSFVDSRNHPINFWNQITFVGHKEIGKPFIMNGKVLYAKVFSK